jgi:hypothetical protein
MCDKCGTIFSENLEDWSTYSGTMKRRREDGSRYTESVTQDACPACTNGGGAVSPRLAVTAPAGADPKLYEEWLEQQAGVIQGSVEHAGH